MGKVGQDHKGREKRGGGRNTSSGESVRRGRRDGEKNANRQQEKFPGAKKNSGRLREIRKK